MQEREPAGEESDHHVQHGGNSGKNCTTNAQPRTDDGQHQFSHFGTDVLELVPHLGGLLHRVAGKGQSRISLSGGTHHVMHGFLQFSNVRGENGKCALGFLVHQTELLKHGGLLFVGHSAEHLFQIGKYINDSPYLTSVVENVYARFREFFAHIHTAHDGEGILHQCGGTLGALSFTGHIGEGAGHFLVGDAQAVGTGYQVRHVAGKVCKLTCTHTFGCKEGVEHFRCRRVFLAHDGKGLR